MALHDEQMFRGIDLPEAYCLIQDIQLDYRAKTAGVMVSVWADQGAYDSGQDPLKSLRFTFDGADVPDAIAAAKTLRTEMYSELTGEPLPIGDSGKIWDWTNATFSDEGP